MSLFYQTLGPDGFGTYHTSWSEDGPTFERVHKPHEATLIPGFVDIHIHGAFGIDFMSATREEMGILSRQLRGIGYEAFLPTTVTASPADVERALSVLDDSDPSIWGFHLEGPFISPEFPGAQPPSSIVLPPVGPSEWDPILDHPALKVITLAPELPNATTLITRLFERGVRVGMGHTNATYDEARMGYECGATHTTHTFNAMRGFHHREAGMVGYALENDGLACELIYDRLHVTENSARVLLHNKPFDQILAVSDSTMATGLEPGRKFTMWGLDVVKGKGDIRLASNGALAGSAITLYDAFVNLVDDFGFEIAVLACCINPRNLLGRTEPPAVWLELDDDLRIVGTLGRDGKRRN
ncbi:MAG: amidohydrolase family protein [Armatimonadetes bacterium]|nr:amidohydrolase family protein [Armatimonadota bacterium]